jgi:23S rRNA (cytosine1962-C5)-methyltransferase
MVVTYGYQEKKWSFRLGMTAFKHIGLFPEQAANWDFIYDRILGLKQADPKVLNVFAYTGGASLVAAAAGASVVHVDAVKQVVNWARDNAEANGLKTIHWIVDDALKFVQREVRRGHVYQGLILDPPAYGRGPAGEKWILEQHLPVLLDACRQLLDPAEGFVVLNLYSMGFSSIIAANLLEYYFDRPHSTLEYGELVLTDRQGFRLPLSVYARF